MCMTPVSPAPGQSMKDLPSIALASREWVPGCIQAWYSLFIQLGNPILSEVFYALKYQRQAGTIGLVHTYYQAETPQTHRDSESRMIGKKKGWLHKGYDPIE